MTRLRPPARSRRLRKEPSLARPLPPVTGGAAGVATPPTLFVLLPIGRRLAIEPGLDMHRTQSRGITTFSGNLSLRVDYAVSRFGQVCVLWRLRWGL